MRGLDLILKKRNGESLSPDEINFLVKQFNEGIIPDYQMAALLMTVFFQGFSNKETNALTTALASSGEMLDFSFLSDIVVDKHSSGGVGDKVTLILAPLVAAAGIPVAKLSGRSLDFTGGTIDKLESIPGFNANLSIDRFMELVSEHGLAIMAQTDRITPAEGKLYALRDATGTVDDISLIAASIMSKKIAAGASAILLDVKTGSGAFMQSKDEAFHLAETMIRIGKDLGKRTVALITDMNQPLGFAVGNALEVKEAVHVLQGEGPRDVEQLCLILGGYLMALTGKVRNAEEGQVQLSRLINSGAAYEKFKQLVVAQGGDKAFLEDLSLLPKASYIQEIHAGKDGYLVEIDAKRVGKAVSLLGAGRASKEQQIDHAVGLVLNHKVGDSIIKGETLAFIHSNNQENFGTALKELSNAFSIKAEAVEIPPLVYGVVPPFPS